MKKKIILSLLFLLSIKSNAQDKIDVDGNKFLISLHYLGNIRNENFIGDNYNGVLGINMSYNLLKEKSFSIQCGLGLDFLNSRKNQYNLKVKNALLVNPNIGIEFNASKKFKPFFNFGYNFFTAKYQINQSYLITNNPQDPAIQTIYGDNRYQFNSLSINPGFRLYFDQKFYAQADYKFLPIESNVNAHIIAIGLGINF